MTLDTVETFEILKRYGIRVARSKVVDSPEGAIAFAERRTDKDPRFMPIVFPPDQTPLHTEEAIRQAYERLARSRAGAILAQAMTEPGTDITILRRADAAHSPITSLETHGNRHLESSEKVRRMLDHLSLKVGEAFDDAGATELRVLVRLHGNAYTVLDGAMTVPREPHLKKRLDPRAHDRMGDDYHPAGLE
ncbi:MAG TPA: hypothetical protein VIN40_08050 [Candidatus Tyrphobacter sp.]